jgi:hypothetical protein
MAIELRQQGYGYHAISKQIGVPPTTVSGWVKHVELAPGQAYKRAIREIYNRRQIPELKSNKGIRERLIQKRGHKCEMCFRRNWLGKPISLHVHHIDGNGDNNEEENLLLVCPNCHSSTETYCGKNINTGKVKVTDSVLLKSLNKHSNNIRAALLGVGLSAKGGNYKRAYKLLAKNPS